MVFQSGCDRCRTSAACTGWLPNSLASSSSSPKPSGNGQPIPAATARSRYSWTVPSPIPQLRAIWRCPNPNSNFNRRTSLTLRMDILLAGTLSSLIDGVSMPGDCPASLHLLLLVCGKHSAPSRTPFRRATKTVRLPTGIGVHLQTGMLFGITTESCSASERNRVHLRPDSPQEHQYGTKDLCPLCSELQQFQFHTPPASNFRRSLSCFSGGLEVNSLHSAIGRKLAQRKRPIRYL